MRKLVKKVKEVVVKHRSLLLRAGVLVALGGAQYAFASTGSGLPWESAFDSIQQSISGPVAGAISVAGIGAAGLTMVFGGELNEWVKRVIYLVGAGALMFGGSTIVSHLYATSGTLIR